MEPFLSIVAKDLYKRFEGDFGNLTVVFPNKRASLFFNQYLVTLADKPIWAPQYKTINDIFATTSDKVIADPIILNSMLYQSYCRKVKKEVKASFDRFFSWGEILLNDFQDIDNNMVDAKNLFCNMADLEKMTSLDYLTEEQTNAIKNFFGAFDKDRKTELHKRFLEIWESMYDIYTDFHESLSKEGLAYEAMLKREAVEKGFEGLKKGRQYAIVGFNVLNQTEKMLFKRLQSEGALFYWDYDERFIKHEAALFVSENIKLFPPAIDTKKSVMEKETDKPAIEVVGVPTDTSQAAYAEKWLKDNISSGEELNKTAVVLCDESLLQGVLHSIPPTFGKEENKTVLNVTMGYPLCETPVASLVSALLDLQQKGLKADGKWRHQYVINILKHPYTQRLAGKDAKELIRLINEKNIIYPQQSLFENNDTLKAIFNQQNGDTLLDYLSDILQRIGVTYKFSKSKEEEEEENEKKKKEEKSLPKELYIESIYEAYTVVNRLINIMQKSEDMVFEDKLGMLVKLIRQILQQQRIAFHGEPAIGVQVMGVLETRNLDFSNIIMLSTNEGMIPKISHSSSFIPYNLRKAYNLTTIEKQTSLYAYYFFRLLQRARKVALVYNNFTEGTKRGEESRFILQLKYEKMYPLTYLKTTAASELEDCSMGIIEKTDKIMEAMTERFSKQGKILSPSALNSYIDCPMQFYLNYVAGLKAETEITEEVGNDVFGNIVHFVLENIYRQMIGRGEVHRINLEEIAKDEVTISQLTDEGFAIHYFNIDKQKAKSFKPDYNGEQIINRHVIINYVKKQLKYDAQLCPMQIIGVEKRCDSTIKGIKLVDGRTIDLNTGGVIDREDVVSINGKAVHRIVDYKTSSLAQKTSSIEELFVAKDKRAKHIFQAMYYCDVLTDKIDEPLAPSIMYVKKANSEDTVPLAKIKDDEITDFRTYKSEYKQRLAQLITEMFDQNIPFTRTQETKICKFCPFSPFCKK